MDFDFSNLISKVELTAEDEATLSKIWKNVFSLSTNDEDYVWAERLSAAIYECRKIKGTIEGAVLFGESAAHIFITNDSGDLDVAMTKFQERFQKVDADARQAFNDNLGLAGNPGN